MDSSLYKSIASGDIDQLKQVISEIDLLLLQQMTPLNNNTLHVAVISNKKECVQEICNRCPSLLTQPNSKGDTPLHIAAKLGLSDIASLLIDKAKTNQEDIESIGEGNHDAGGTTVPVQWQQLLRMRNNTKDTALHDAVRNHRFAVVKLLTEADPTFQYLECNDAGETPLYLAAEDGLLDCVDQILKTCPSSAHAGPRGRTALHAAAMSTNSDVTKKLLDKKPNIIKEADEYGCTALHYATFFGMAVMVAQLLDIDSSAAYMSNRDGKTALHIAVMLYNRTDIIEELTRRCPDCWEMLDKKGHNFLHVASEIGQYEVIEYVLRQQNMMVEYLINQQDNNGNTPLHLATISQRADVVKILCTDNRVNKTILNKDAFTAMNSTYNDLVKDPDSDLVESVFSYMKQAGARHSWRSNIIQEFEDQLNKIINQHHTNTDTGDREEVDKRRQTDLLVATLIATVTFAAGFTLPGGYNSDGSHKGMATLASIPAFIVFVISNSIAMLLSTFTVFINFWPHPTKSLRGQQMHRFCADLGYRCTYIAIIAMVVAFVTGTYGVLLHSPRLSIPTVTLGCSFFILCVIFFYKAYKLVGIKIFSLYISPPKK